MSIRSLLFAALGVLGSSCGLFGEDFTVSRTVSIHATPEDQPCQKDQIKVDLNENGGFTSVKDNLYSLELKKVRVEVTHPKTHPDSAATLAHGSITVSDSAAGDVLTLGTYQDVALTQGAAQELEFDPTGAKKLIDLARNPPHTFFIHSEGCADQVPAFFDFDVALTFHATLGI